MALRQLSKEQAKEELISLIKDFKNNSDYYQKLSEADVEDKLVNELFVNILGWDKKDYEKRIDCAIKEIF